MRAAVCILLASAAMGCGREPTAHRAPQKPAAPAPPPGKSAAPRPPTRAELSARTLDALTDAVARRDAGAFAALYTEDAVSRGPGAKDEGRGPRAVARRIEGLLAPFASPTLVLVRALIKDDRVVVEWVLSGAHTREALGVPARGAWLSLRGASVLSLDGRAAIREEHVYYDAGALRAQAAGEPSRARPPDVTPDAAPAARVDVHDTRLDGDPQGRHVAVLEALFSAFDAHDADAYASLLTDDVTWDDVSQPLPTRGASEARRFVRGFVRAFPDARSSLPFVAGVGAKWAVAEVVVTATQRAPFHGEKGAGRPVIMRSLDVVELDGAKIVRAATYGDAADVRAQLGWR